MSSRLRSLEGVASVEKMEREFTVTAKHPTTGTFLKTVSSRKRYDATNAMDAMLVIWPDANITVHSDIPNIDEFGDDAIDAN